MYACRRTPFRVDPGPDDRVDLGESRRTAYILHFTPATIGHPIAGPVSGYLEFFQRGGRQFRFGMVGTVDAGFTWAVHDNWIDVGFNFGVTPGGTSFNPFLGVPPL